VHQLTLYKTSLYFKRQRCNNQRFLNWNLNLFWFTHHLALSPITPNTPYLPHSFTKLSNFCRGGNTRWKTTDILWASEENEQCVGILKCLLTSLSTLKWTNRQNNRTNCILNLPIAKVHTDFCLWFCVFDFELVLPTYLPTAVVLQLEWTNEPSHTTMSAHSKPFNTPQKQTIK
jgi:hypothetical protein